MCVFVYICIIYLWMNGVRLTWFIFHGMMSEHIYVFSKRKHDNDSSSCLFVCVCVCMCVYVCVYDRILLNTPPRLAKIPNFTCVYILSCLVWCVLWFFCCLLLCELTILSWDVCVICVKLRACVCYKQTIFVTISSKGDSNVSDTKRKLEDNQNSQKSTKFTTCVLQSRRFPVPRVGSYTYTRTRTHTCYIYMYVPVVKFITSSCKYTHTHCNTHTQNASSICKATKSGSEAKNKNPSGKNKVLSSPSPTKGHRSTHSLTPSLLKKSQLERDKPEHDNRLISEFKTSLYVFVFVLALCLLCYTWWSYLTQTYNPLYLISMIVYHNYYYYYC